MTQHPFKTAIEEFDAAYHKVRAHLLHALGDNGHQLEHDAETAAKPLVAEAKQDAVNLAEEAVSGASPKPAEFEAAAATKAAVAPKTTEPAVDASWSPKASTDGQTAS